MKTHCPKILRGALAAFASAALSITSAAGAGDAASFAAFDAKARAGERLTVVFFGGSLTWGANASEPNTTGFRGRMAARLEAKYPDARFKFVDAAIGGTGSELGVFRLERDVLPKRPDLVFLDFSCNDGGENTKIEPTCCYEYLLRRMIGEGIPVVQMFFTFKAWAPDGDAHPRRLVYRRLADEYRTGVGDVYDDGLGPALRSGRVAKDDVWPLDGGHPCDLGYELFAEAGMAGFDRAVAEGRVCRVPAKPVFGTVENARRTEAAEIASGAWRRKLTYRTSLWYDGLSSRWMDGIAAFSGAARSPLAIRADANMIGVFGEADENALTAAVLCDGAKIADFNAYHRAGKGRLFFWRRAYCEPGEHAFTIDPEPDGKGEFRIGAVCTATVVPNESATAAPQGAGDAALEKLDHARGSAN